MNVADVFSLYDSWYVSHSDHSHKHTDYSDKNAMQKF